MEQFQKQMALKDNAMGKFDFNYDDDIETDVYPAEEVEADLLHLDNILAASREDRDNKPNIFMGRKANSKKQGGKKWDSLIIAL